MMEPSRPVSHDEFDGRKLVEDERFRRDKERLDKHEDVLDRLARTNERLTMIVDRMDGEMIDHDKRLDKLESQPADTWGKVKWAVASAIITGSVTAGIAAALAIFK